MKAMLADKTILLTGAGGVLGTAYVENFLEEGATVLASDLPGARAKILKERFSHHERFAYYDLDITSESEVSSIFNTLEIDGFEPNVVINNAAITGEFLMAGGADFPDFASTSVTDWEKTIRVNLLGPFMLARQMDIDIVGRYPAQLINVASMYALQAPHHEIYNGVPFKSFSAYSASKAGIHGLTLWLASYWASRNCTVNSIAPGAVFNNHSRNFEERVGRLTMAGRMAEPAEIANVMTFLCSENSRYMTGQLVQVDGGFSSW